MNKFKKLFNYYLSSYWNNSRTLSSMYSFLKIFFERNNKIDNTVSSFGNVFRNSKWSNMQLQNIKKLFMKQWLSFFSICVLFLLLTLTYTGTALDISYLSVFYIKQTLNEFVTNWYYFIGCVLFQLNYYLRTLFWGNQQFTTTSLPHSLTNLNLSEVSVRTTTYSKVNTNLFFLQKTLLNLNNLNPLPTLVTSNNLQTLQLNATFNNQVVGLSIPTFKPLGLTSEVLINENLYVLSTHLNPTLKTTLTVNTDLQTLYNKESGIAHDPMVTETLTHGLNNIAKQQRWLTRNFWSNQGFITDSNRITEAKKFIQNPLLSQTGTDSNIWLSNKLSGLETEKTTSSFNKLTPNTQLLSVFNFFDTSRFFLNQRYTLLNQLPNQFITSSAHTTSTGNLVNTQTTINLKSNLLQSYFIRNITFNTSLYNSSYTPNSNGLAVPSTTDSLSMSTKSHNIFVSTLFTDLLQQWDLQALSTVNASANTSNKLHLNRNYNPTNFKS